MASILIVDDLISIHEMLEAVIHPTGHKTAFATDGEKALIRYKAEKYDLVLCDIDIPGMDGGDISAALFAHPETRDIPVVFLTALVTPQDLAAKGNQLGGRAAISKQSPIEEIAARIRTALA